MSLIISAYPDHEITPPLAQTAKPLRTLESRWATGFDIPPVIPFFVKKTNPRQTQCQPQWTFRPKNFLFPLSFRVDCLLSETLSRQRLS
jgi:hypothetical protein